MTKQKTEKQPGYKFSRMNRQIEGYISQITKGGKFTLQNTNLNQE